MLGHARTNHHADGDAEQAGEDKPAALAFRLRRERHREPDHTGRGCVRAEDDREGVEADAGPDEDQHADCDGEQAVQAQSPPHLRQLRVGRLHGVIEPGLHLGYPQIGLQTTGLSRSRCPRESATRLIACVNSATRRSAVGRGHTRRLRRAAAASRRRAGRAASPSARDAPARPRASAFRSAPPRRSRARRGPREPPVPTDRRHRGRQRRVGDSPPSVIDREADAPVID